MACNIRPEASHRLYGIVLGKNISRRGVRKFESGDYGAAELKFSFRED